MQMNGLRLLQFGRFCLSNHSYIKYLGFFSNQNDMVSLFLIGFFSAIIKVQ